MGLKKIFIGVLCFAGFALSAQSEMSDKRGKIYGVIRDSVTNAPVPDVHVTVNGFGVISNVKGEFYLSITDTDTIFFSHVGYKPLAIACKKFVTESTLTIYLVQDVTLLREVTVSSFYTEDEFKAKLLTTEPKISRAQEVANENSMRMKAIAKYAPRSLTINEQFYAQMKGPQGVTLFSNDPSKGIIKTIKAIFSPESYTVPKISTRSAYRDKSLTFKSTRVPKDTTSTGNPSVEPLLELIPADTTQGPTVKSAVKDKL